MIAVPLPAPTSKDLPCAQVAQQLCSMLVLVADPVAPFLIAADSMAGGDVCTLDGWHAHFKSCPLPLCVDCSRW